MKKFFKVFLTLVLLSGMGYFGFKYLYKTDSLLSRIHKEADSVLRIGLHDIKETLVLDALTSPARYFEEISFTSKSSPKDSLFDTGFELRPYNIVFFTVPSVKNTFFTVIPIKDSAAFQKYIADQLNQKAISIENGVADQYRYAVSPKYKMAFAWNLTELVIAISPSPAIQKVEVVFLDILKDGKTIKDKKHPVIKALTESSDHITYLNDKSKVTCNFKDGQAILNGVLYTDRPQQFTKESVLATVSDASLALHFDTNLENKENRTKALNWLANFELLEKNNLKATEIVERTNGLFSFSIDGKVKQTDTIITYEYDDNFEKIEKKVVQEKEVPKIHIDLGKKGNSLRTYLQAHDALSGSGELKSIPFYRFFVKDGNTATSFDTFQGKTTILTDQTSNFFELSVDFNALKNHVEIPQIGEYLRVLKALQIHAQQLEGNKVQLKGTITGYQPDINIISQVFFAVDSEKETY